MRRGDLRYTSAIQTWCIIFADDMIGSPQYRFPNKSPTILYIAQLSLSKTKISRPFSYHQQRKLTMNHPQSHLALFARFPTPGCSKTRLIPRLGPKGACTFARAALTDTLHLFSTLPSSHRTLFYTPVTAHADVLQLLEEESLDSAWSIHPQIDSADLGARLADAVGYLSHQNPGSITVTLIGMDCLDLTVTAVRDSMDLVAVTPGSAHMIPAVDGGYVLLTVPGECRRDVAFGDIPWSCDRTGQVQLRRIEEAGLRCRVAGELSDVDEPGDLEALWRAREGKRGKFPRTVAFLEGVMDR